MINSILESIEKLTLLEAAQLVKAMEEKFGVSASISQVAVPQVVATEIKEEKNYNVILNSCGNNKIAVLKRVREITGLGLKEAKDLVDNVPKEIKQNLKKDEAEELSKKLQNIGAIMEIKEQA